MSDPSSTGVSERELDDAALEALAEAYATPPPLLIRERVLAAARHETAVKRLGRALVRYRMIGAVAAGAALALGGLLGREARLTASQVLGLDVLRRTNGQLASKLDEQQRQLAGLRNTIDAQAQVLRVVGGPRTLGAALEPQGEIAARGRVLVDASSGEAAIFVSGLAPTGPGKTYELWSIRGNHPPEPAGVFAVGDTAAVAARVARIERAHEVTAFTVSIEPSGGSTTPTGPIVLAGSVAS